MTFVFGLFRQFGSCFWSFQTIWQLLQVFLDNLAVVVGLFRQFGSCCRAFQTIWQLLQDFLDNLAVVVGLFRQFGSCCRAFQTIWQLLQVFLDNLAVVVGLSRQFGICCRAFQTIWQLLQVFLTQKDKHNIRPLSKNIKFICICCETGQQSSPKALFFLPVSKAHTNKLYIFQQCTYIVYIHMQLLIFI